MKKSLLVCFGLILTISLGQAQPPKKKEIKTFTIEEYVEDVKKSNDEVKEKITKFEEQLLNATKVQQTYFRNEINKLVANRQIETVKKYVGNMISGELTVVDVHYNGNFNVPHYLVSCKSDEQDIYIMFPTSSKKFVLELKKDQTVNWTSHVITLNKEPHETDSDAT